MIGRIGAARGSRSRTLLLNGHLDTVGVEGMTHAPWQGAILNGRLYGRGATDMKAGVAAMCAAAARAAAMGIDGEVIVAAVADEEYQSIGTRALVESGIRADAAIVTEPTRLAVCPAHRGFAWLELVVHGTAAHGSRWDIGVDAITLAAMVIAEVERHQQEVLTRKSHPLLGRPSVHASLVSGGIGLSTYPDRCSVHFERRTIPGESPAHFVREVEEACARVRAERPELRVEVKPGFSQLPNDTSADDPIVRALLASLSDGGRPASIAGLACWTDAALLSAAGIPAVCFGPGDIALAHAAEEYVLVSDIEGAVQVMSAAITHWFAGRD